MLGATTARDLVTALTDLLNVQNDFLSVWISQESLRRSLDFDLGTMQLDSSGVWLDPGPIEKGNTNLDGDGAGEFVPHNFPEWGENGIERLPEPSSNGAGREAFNPHGPPQRPAGGGAVGGHRLLPDTQLFPPPPAQVLTPQRPAGGGAVGDHRLLPGTQLFPPPPAQVPTPQRPAGGGAVGDHRLLPGTQLLPPPPAQVLTIPIPTMESVLK